MQLKLLGIAGTTSISATAAAIKGLSKEEAIAALATTELNETEMAAALVKAGYTNATATQTAALAVEAREKEAEAAATLESAAADTVATGTTTGLSVATTGLTTVLKGLWATLMANPFVLVLAGLAALIAAVDAYQKRVERAAEALSNSSEEVKSLQSEIDNLNSELKTTQDKIEELLRKPSLTIVEQNELKNLQITNNELERQIELKERALKVSQGKNADNFVNAVNSKKTENGGDGWWFGYRNYGDFKTSPYKDKDHPNRPEANTTGKSEEQYYMFQVRLEDYQEAEAKYQKALQDGNEQEAKQWEERRTELNTAMSGYVSDMTGYLTNLGEYDYSSLSKEAKEAVDYINDIQNAYLMVTGDSGDSVFSNIYNQGRFAEGKKAIDDLKESGKLTAEAFQELYNSNDSVKAMVDNMKEVGLVNDTTANTFSQLTNQILGTKSAAEEAAQIKKMPFSELISGEGVKDTINGFKTRLSELAEALEKLQSGKLSNSDLLELFEKFPELANRTDDLDTALNELIDSTKIEIGNQFDSWNKSMPTDEDAEGLNAVKNSLIGIVEKTKDIEQLSEEIKKLNSALDSLQSTYNDIQGVIDDYNKNGYLTLDNLQSLMDLEPEYLNALIDENGQINLNTQAYKDYVAAKAKTLVVDQIKSLYEHLLEMSAEEAQAYANATAYNAETRSLEDLIGATTQYYLVLARAKDAKNNTTAYTDALKQSFGTVANYVAVYDSWLNSLSSSSNEFSTATDEATSALESQKEALESQKDALEDEKDALENAKDALEDYKDALNDAKDDINDLIDLTTDYIKQLKNDEKDALEEQKSQFDDLISKRKEVLELAKEEREEADKLADKQNAVVKDKLALAIAQLDDSSAGKKTQKKAAENLKSSNKDLTDYLYEQEYNARVAALEAEQEAFDNSIDEQKDKIDEYLSNVRQLYEDACSMIDNDTGELYGNLWDYTYKYTTQTRAEFDNLWSNAQSAIQRYRGDNESLLSVMENIQLKIYDTDVQIGNLNTQIDNCETQISELDTAISNTSDAINDTSSAIDNVSSSLDGLSSSISDYINQLNQLANTSVGDNANKTSFWVNYNGKKYETGYNYNGDTKGNRLLAASELTKLIAKDVSGFENYGLSQVQALLGVGGNETGHKWTYKFDGKTYESRAATKTLAVADIRSQLAKKYGNSSFVLDQVYGKITGYAEGTKSATGGLHIVDEEGLFSEFIPYQIGKGRYSFLPEGNPVFSKAMTNTMFDFASDPTKFVNNVIKNSSKKINGDTNISSAPVYNIYGKIDNETLSKMDKQERQRYELFKKQFMLEMLREKNNL